EFKASVLAEPFPKVSAGGAGAPAGVAEGEGPPEALESVIVDSSEYIPWLLPGDRLVVAPGRAPQNGQLGVVALPGQPHAIRRFIAGSPALLVHPADSRNVTRLPPGEEPPWRGT